MTEIVALTTIEQKLGNLSAAEMRNAGLLVEHLLDTVTVATPRGTHYESQADIVAAAKEAHREVLAFNRSVYQICLASNGALDWSRQLGIRALLEVPYTDAALFTQTQDTLALTWLAMQLPIHRRLKLFCDMADARVNNSRTRRLILESILNDRNLEWLAIKYTALLNKALRHALGQRHASILKSILGKVPWADADELIYLPGLNDKEHNMVESWVGKFCQNSDPTKVGQFLSFVLGNEGEFTGQRYQAYYAARTDLEAMKLLPPEVAEGIRSVYHPDVQPADVLELTKRSMTDKQRIRVQRSAARRGVVVDKKAARQDAVDLYVYAYETGRYDDETHDALKEQALAAAAGLPFRFGKLNIVVDASRSMRGHKTQKWRPIAVAMSTVDMLREASDQTTVLYASGRVDDENVPLITPDGPTNLAPALVAAVQGEPDTVIVVSDGYENAPAGRVGEVLAHLEKMGVDVPIYQASPVMSAKTVGTRALSDVIPVLPVSKPTGLGTGMLKLMLTEDLARGIHGLVNLVAPKMLGEG